MVLDVAMIPDFSSPGVSPRLRDTIWEWPGDEAIVN